MLDERLRLYPPAPHRLICKESSDELGHEKVVLSIDWERLFIPSVSLLEII